MKRLWGPFIFCILAGLAIVMTAISGHTRIAAFEFPCLIVIGTLLFYALGRTRTMEAAATTNNQNRSNKVFRFFGWLLLVGILLQVSLQIQRTLINHQQFHPEFIVQYVIELALVYFLNETEQNQEQLSAGCSILNAGWPIQACFWLEWGTQCPHDVILSKFGANAPNESKSLP